MIGFIFYKIIIRSCYIIENAISIKRFFFGVYQFPFRYFEIIRYENIHLIIVVKDITLMNRYQKETCKNQ